MTIEVPERYADPLKRLAGKMRDADPAEIPLTDANAWERARTTETGRKRDRSRAKQGIHRGKVWRRRARDAEERLEHERRRRESLQERHEFEKASADRWQQHAEKVLEEKGKVEQRAQEAERALKKLQKKVHAPGTAAWIARQLLGL